MATQICDKCGVRNPGAATTCRRCSAELSGQTADSLSQITLGGTWRLGHSLASNPHLFRGKHAETGQPVLVKALNESAALDRSVRSRFLKEARLLEELEHPHLIKVIEVVDDRHRPGLVMAYPSGQSLSEFLALRERVPVPIAIAFGLQVLDALDYLHENGISLRNLSADNLHITRDPETGQPHLVVSDFGLAKDVHLASSIETQTGTLMGMQMAGALSHVRPSAYTAPEILDDESDNRSDLYSLGVILFKLVTGRLPVAQGVSDADAMVTAVREEVPTTMRLLRPEVSTEFENAAAKLLAKSPEERFLDVAQVRTELFRILDGAMVRVDAGPFIRGSAEDDEDARSEEKPQREIGLSAFFIDRTPVTSAAYRKFLLATGRPIDEDWARHNPAEQGDLPVVYVTWQEASDYASWAGKRLPTEAEWEKAARGTDGRTYPWGEEAPDGNHAQFGKKQRVKVGSFPAGASPYGCLDMSGNVFEWVHDVYDRGFYARAPGNDPTGPREGTRRVLRGGSFVHEEFALRCATRGRYEPDERRANHGFRCVWSAD